MLDLPWILCGFLCIAGIGGWLFASKLVSRQSTTAGGEDSEARVIVEASPDGLIRLDKDLLCTFASPTAADLFELSPEEMLGRRLIDIVGDEATTAVRLVDEVRLNARVAETTFRLYRGAAECRWIEIRCAPLAGEGGCVASFRDITLRHAAEAALRVANSELNKLAGSDALTELANRRRLDQMLETECRRASRNAIPVSLLMIEVDDFRSFNELYGHAAADACLKRVAGALRGAMMQPAFLVARLGGEDFAVLLPGLDGFAAAQAADHVRATIAALGIPHRGRPDARDFVTASVGCATIEPMPDTLAGAGARLVAEADAALHALRHRDQFPPLVQPRTASAAEHARTGASIPAGTVQGLDQIARIAAVLLGLPAAFVVRLKDGELTIVGQHGLGHEAIARDWCAQGLRESGTLVVPDTSVDPLFWKAREDAGFGFLAAAPLLHGRSGQPIGALWVVDRAARATWGESEPLLLTQLASLAVDGLDPRRPKDVEATLKVA